MGVPAWVLTDNLVVKADARKPRETVGDLRQGFNRDRNSSGLDTFPKRFSFVPLLSLTYLFDLYGKVSIPTLARDVCEK